MIKSRFDAGEYIREFGRMNVTLKEKNSGSQRKRTHIGVTPTFHEGNGE